MLLLYYHDIPHCRLLHYIFYNIPYIETYLNSLGMVLRKAEEAVVEEAVEEVAVEEAVEEVAMVEEVAVEVAVEEVVKQDYPH